MDDMHVTFLTAWGRLGGEDSKTHAQLASSGREAVNPSLAKASECARRQSVGPVQYGSLCRYLQKARLIVMGRWDATKNSLLLLLNKWALGCDFTAATSDITPALIRAVGRREHSFMCMHVRSSLFLLLCDICMCRRGRFEGIRKRCVRIESWL